MTGHADLATLAGADIELVTPGGSVVPASVATVSAPDHISGSFTVDVLVSAQIPAAQGIYVLRAGECDELPVFLVPTEHDRPGLMLHAVFNPSLPHLDEDGEPDE